MKNTQESSFQEALIQPKSFERCSAYCSASLYELKKLMVWLNREQIAATFFRSSNVVHLTYGQNKGDVFYFSYGTVVLWGLTKAEEKKILTELQPFEEDSVNPPKFEESRFVIGNIAKIAKDDITLPSTDVLTKLAFSHGLAQSVKLEVFERLIAQRIERTRYVPENLARKGRIPLSRRKLLRTMGTLLQERNSINLHTDILDTPEFFWEHADLEPLYRLIAQDLELIPRLDVLNKRLDIVRELFEVLGTELSHRHSSRLEWIIIVLISIEVIMEVMKEFLKLL